jgi:hypothetical protein
MNLKLPISFSVLLCLISPPAEAQMPSVPCRIVKQAQLPANAFPLDTLSPTPLELVGPEAFKAAANITLKHGSFGYQNCPTLPQIA